MKTIPMRLVLPHPRRGAKSGDAGAIVHDIGNLLQVLSCTIGAIERAADRGESDLSTFIKRARSTIDQAGHLTRRIVDSEIGREKRVAIGAWLEDFGDTLSLAAGPDVTTRIDIDDDAPDLFCDPAELERVLLNLVVNARDAMAGGGTLRITGRRGPFPPGMVGDTLILSVADTGCGMSEDVRRRACEPCFTTKPAGKGSGVGLATVNAFAQEQSGSIHIDSTPGKGTKISLLLPAAVRRDARLTRAAQRVDAIPYMAA